MRLYTVCWWAIVEREIALSSKGHYLAVKTSARRGCLTNRSAACPVNAGFDGEVRPAIPNVPWSGDSGLTGTVAPLFCSDWSRNGFRDVGLSGAVLGKLPKEVVTGEGRLLAGDTARFRKGLFEGKFDVSPGEICRSGSNEVDVVLADSRRVFWAGERFKRAIALLIFRFWVT